MFKFIFETIIAIYITSTSFMLFFFFNAQIMTYAREKHFFKIPLKLLLLTHFCPIIHTQKVFQILHKYMMKREI